MDLMQENPNEDNKVKNLKNSLIVIIAFALVLIIIAVVIYIYSLRITDEKLKIRIDGTSNSELEANEQAVVFDEEKLIMKFKMVSISSIQKILIVVMELIKINLKLLHLNLALMR